MRIALFSDIHGNRHAFDAVLADIQAQQPDRLYCLGDLVGYGAFPDAVVETIRRAGYPTVMGNYDDGVGFDRAECGCAYREARDREFGRQSLEWTKAHTTDDNKAFLRRLVPEIRFEVFGTRVLCELFVNVGSLGKPKDGDPRAGYAVLEFGAQPVVTFRRVPYDVAAAVRAVLRSDLPDKFALDLEYGKVPASAGSGR